MELIVKLITNPIVITTWLIFLGILIVFLEKELRLNKLNNNNTRKRLVGQMFAQYICVLILATHLLTIAVSATLYFQENSKINKRKDSIISEMNNQIEGIQYVFTDVFPHAERCHASGSESKDCTPDRIKNRIYSNISKKIMVYPDMEFIRYAEDSRLEYLSPFTGEFRSYTAQDNPFGKKFHNDLQNHLSLTPQNRINHFLQSMVLYFFNDFTLDSKSIYPKVFYFTVEKNKDVQGVLTYARPGDTDIIFYTYGITIPAFLFFMSVIFLDPISLHGVYSFLWVIVVTAGYVIFRVQRQKKMSS